MSNTFSNTFKYLDGDGLTYLWEKIRGNFATSTHTHDYLPLTGGTLTGNLICNGNVTATGNVTAKYFSGYANAVGGDGFKIYPENTNQINFGGVSSDPTIVFGAASRDGRSVPTTYKFGTNGDATIQAASFSGSAAKLSSHSISELTYAKIYTGEFDQATNKGVFVQTDINASSNVMVSAHIWGNSYNVKMPINTYIQFYNYNSTGGILQPACTHYGYDLGNVYAFNYNSKVCFWVSVGNQSFQTMYVFVGTQLDGGLYNHVSLVTNAAKPGSGISREVTIVPRLNAFVDSNVVSANSAKNVHVLSNNDNTSYPLLFVGARATGTIDGDFRVYASSNITVNPSTNTITGNVIGNLKGNVDESYLTYGTTSSISGSVSPFDMAISNIHSANRIAFGKPTGVTIEYSTDGGTNWVDYGTTDGQKTNLISGIGSSFKVCGPNNTHGSTTDALRITLNATVMGVYTRPRKTLINISTNGATGCTVTVEYATNGDPTNFSTLGTYSINGWSGWNSIPISSLGTFGGASSMSSNKGTIRFTFAMDGTTDGQANDLEVKDIAIYGETYWATPSTMAKTGHIYSYDALQNVEFPSQVTANTLRADTIFGTNSISANALSVDTSIMAMSDNASAMINQIFGKTYYLLSPGSLTAPSTDPSQFGSTYSAILSGENATLSINDLFNTYGVELNGSTQSIFSHITNAKVAIGTLQSTDVVKNVGIKQGEVITNAITGEESVTDHSIWITHKKGALDGSSELLENKTVIPPATTDFNGSMSYTDKRKLDNLLYVVDSNNKKNDMIVGISIQTSTIKDFDKIFNSTTQPNMIRVNLSDISFVCTLSDTNRSSYFRYYEPYNKIVVNVTSTAINISKQVTDVS